MVRTGLSRQNQHPEVRVRGCCNLSRTSEAGHYSAFRSSRTGERRWRRCCDW